MKTCAPVYYVVFVFTLILSGCAGTHSFPNRVLAGGTVEIGAGYKHDFRHDNVTVRFIPEVGPDIVYNPGNPAIRSILNLYPDPLSSIVISQQTGADITSGSRTYGDMINNIYTGKDNDWWQSTVFMDVPASLPTGITTVEISNPAGDIATSQVEIIGNGGVPDDYKTEFGIVLNRTYFSALERVDHFIVTINSATVPSAIELELAATDFAGYVTQGRGEAVSLNWSETGGAYKIIMTSTTSGSTKKVQDFKLYIAVTGGLASTADLNLVGAVQAFDENGNAIIGVTASIQLERGVAGLFGI
ncbi:MAG: hypothetical protein QM500_05090 [Methylococcales bacterium]